MRTEIDLPNPEERLYPGMYAEVSLEMNRRPDALTVPAAAVGSDGDGNFVYTITDNRITRLAIKTGLTDNGRIEVTAGLSEETPVRGDHQGVPATTRNGGSAGDGPREPPSGRCITSSKALMSGIAKLA